MDTYSAKQASAYSGLPLTMVNYLCRQGLLTPSTGLKPGRGRARQYTFGDIVILRALGKLLVYGISVARLKKVLNTIKEYHKDITPNTLPAKYIITDGVEIYFDDGRGGLETLDEKGQMAFSFVLELDSLQSEVNQSIANFG